MRVSFLWLRELLPDLQASAGEVAGRLSSVGLEVESVLDLGAGLSGVVVATVVRVEPHPSRDKLRLVTVDLGAGKEERVVCGAANVPSPGGGVVFAPLGTHLPAVGMRLERRPIGGVESAGMLCSEAELGLAASSEGIIVFEPGKVPPGTPLAEVLPSAFDVVYTIGITPNRPDALGHLGVARDLSAAFGITLAPPGTEEPEAVAGRAAGMLTVSIEEPERCPLYAAALVDGVKLAPSPDWLRHRLHLLGVRPVSNVVDVTNLVLLERGQPMHAFDRSHVAGGTIIVRRARPGEQLTTLDGAARKLDPDDLVIADSAGPSALAGVMGGSGSEIREATEQVLLECAYFQPSGVRRASRRHGLSTDSSYRFERGTDWDGVLTSLERARSLLVALAGGSSVPGTIVARGASLERRSVRLRSRRLDALLGTHVPFDEAGQVLQRLGFSVKTAETAEGPVLDATVPSFRPDVSREADLIEEVARIRGFDRIPTVLPAIAPAPPRPTLELESRVLREATALGLSEAVTYSFVSEKELEAVHAPRPVVRLRNPMTEERSVLRTSLLPGLLDVLRRARRHGEADARLFAVGSLFLSPSERSETATRKRNEEDRGVLPEERPAFAAVLAGSRTSHLSKPVPVDVLDAKGLAVELVERLTGRPASAEAMTPDQRAAHLHPRGAAWVVVGARRVGRFGPIHPDVVEKLALEGPAQIVELDLFEVESLGQPTPRYRPIPRLPAVARDVALVVSEDVPAARVQETIVSAAGDLCESVELFDLWSGAGIPDGFRSLAYRLVYRDPRATTEPEKARTLTDDEVDRRHDLVRKAIANLGELRG